MASITWTGVFSILLIELGVTFLLVVPVPRKIRNFVARKCIFRFHLGDNFSKIIWFIAVALILALVESYKNTTRLLEKIHLLEDQDLLVTGTAVGGPHSHHHHYQDKQRLYKAERNMYLAGFALTLLFVIGRILQLMQESAEFEEQLTYVTRQQQQSSTLSGTDKGVEMTEAAVKAKPPAEKKKD